MQWAALFASLLAIAAAEVGLPGMAQATSMNIGVQTDIPGFGFKVSLSWYATTLRLPILVI
jgi:hypothetical protein